MTRIGDKETRDIYRAAQRVQGYMLKQGVSDAKNMGASGINTAAEAKMYFQSAPQIDYSSPDAMIDSAKALDEYTKSFNSKHNVNYKKGDQQPTTTQQQAPAQAIQALQSNPSLAPQFKAKYGYLPQGFQ
ncbi:hypothetical protein [Citrobacter portucalensis]|uniref:hypothetical protein n=1 Tax=Citrobacter portucalensis TaxID=1639133 RepID=UPI00226BA298|nr:hypothetical protein [Citrobacter portucalensis]MCX8985112.1 hypothetical protein [Citrobacter portucalensis]